LTNLKDEVAPLPGEYAAISILKPVIYVERAIDAKGLMLYEAASSSAAEPSNVDELDPFEFTDSDSDDEEIIRSGLRSQKSDKGDDFKPVESFRITTSFTIEAEILAFDQR
jgi:hypothetical protein